MPNAVWAPTDKHKHSLFFLDFDKLCINPGINTFQL